MSVRPRTMRALWALCILTLVAGCCRKPKRGPPPGPVEWTVERVPASSNDVQLKAIAGSGATDVWAVGQGIFHYDGRAWSDATPPRVRSARVGFLAISVAAPDDVWLAGNNGWIAHYDGASWQAEQLEVARVSSSPVVQGYYDLIDVVAWPTEAWVTYSRRGYLRFDGSSWSVVPTPELGPRTLQQVWGTGPRDVWLPGGRMVHYDGAGWHASTVLPAGLREAHGTAPDDVWAVGWKGNHKDDVGAAFHYDGSSWAETPLPAGAALLWNVAAAGRGEAYAVGQLGWALAWDGATWRPSNTGRTETLRAVYSPGGGEAFAVGELGPHVLHRR